MLFAVIDDAFTKYIELMMAVRKYLNNIGYTIAGAFLKTTSIKDVRQKQESPGQHYVDMLKDCDLVEDDLKWISFTPTEITAKTGKEHADKIKNSMNIDTKEKEAVYFNC